MNGKSELRNAWYDMITSFRLRRESKKGRLSLSTYLSVIGEYTDRLIIESEKNGLQFVEGKCEAQILRTNRKYVKFDVMLIFLNQGEMEEKTATRDIPVKKFVSGSIKSLYEEKQTFDIMHP